jgi:hypothetical protein
VLRIIFRPKRGEAIGGWRIMHNEGLHNLYSSQIIIRIIKVKEDMMDTVCSTHGKKRNVYKILVGNSEEKRPLGRKRCTLNYNIITDFGQGG